MKLTIYKKGPNKQQYNIKRAMIYDRQISFVINNQCQD